MNIPERRLFDTRHIRHAFARAANSYDAAATVQHEVEARLLESLDYLENREPEVVLDLGSGPGHAATAMRQRWPRARVIALDIALPMLRAAHVPWRPFRKPVDRLCADARALPLADNTVDVLFSNLCLQWVDDLPATLAGLRRVLKPGALLLVSSFGPDTLCELRQAFDQAEQSSPQPAPHVSPFATLAQLGDALMLAGFRDPVLDRDALVTTYADMTALMRELRAIGATNALHARRTTLTGRTRFAQAAAAYDNQRRADGTLPATWEVITAMAWAPAAGTPIREAGIEIAQFPADRIPVRRR